MNYLHNHVPTITLPPEITTHEMMNHCKPNLSHLCVWGCQCFVLIPPELCSKGGPCCFEAIFVSYEEDRIGWCVRDLQGKYHFSQDAIFNESMPAPSDPPAKSTHPTCKLNPTSKGQAFAEAIRIRNECLTSRQSAKPVHC